MYALQKAVKHLAKVSLSNDIVSPRIHDLASYVEQELVARLQTKHIFFQMDVSSDVASLTIWLVIGLYLCKNSVEEYMIMGSSLAAY